MGSLGVRWFCCYLYDHVAFQPVGQLFLVSDRSYILYLCCWCYSKHNNNWNRYYFFYGTFVEEEKDPLPSICKFVSMMTSLCSHMDPHMSAHPYIHTYMYIYKVYSYEYLLACLTNSRIQNHEKAPPPPPSDMIWWTHLMLAVGRSAIQHCDLLFELCGKSVFHILYARFCFKIRQRDITTLLCFLPLSSPVYVFLFFFWAAQSEN